MNFTTMKGLFKKRPNRKQWFIISASLVVLLIAGLFIFEGTKTTVALTLDGETKEIRTHAKTVEDILVDLDINYKAHDYVSPALDTKIKENQKIVWKQAQQVILKVDGEEQKVWTTSDTVGQFLKEQNLVVNDQDKLNVAADTKIKNDLEIQLDVAFKVVVNDGGTEKEVWSTSTTVADFLEQQGIKLNELDRIEPELEQTLSKDSVVKVIRVEKVTDVVEESIDYSVVTKKDSSLENGKQKVVQTGQEGKLQKKYEVVMENGVVVSKKLISEEVVQESTDKIVAVGTKVIQQTVSRGAETGKEFYVTSTAYTADCNGCSGRTATGIDLKANPNIKVIAVDPSVIPLGTKVWVEGYGYAVAADIGGNVSGYKIDVYFPTQSEAYRWGMKKVKIKILE
ncbi:ubiquitin-like domain-containing protein [Caldibacillus lycopersici]|uniref:Ubiquitin-like domain-containing protein n=1 Tax=Perspicuibacillus lycopersici TaxID=1325689 RepID=A0AAE3IYK6_9BACI|nr:G5 and 3D domain-containing protein [Perspicuibacillus lycopersici]MCU9615299.1 ubiquitin-like domain-containing protein [Perspicuibacillus lycopersici]